MKVEELISEAASIIERRVPKGAQVVLFGSQAKGTASPTADIDLGILFDAPITFEDMTRIRAEIEALPTLRRIDLVDLQTVDAGFRESVLKNYKIITHEYGRAV